MEPVLMSTFPAPPLVQRADESLILEMGAVIFPGFVKKNQNGDGLVLCLEGSVVDGALEKIASENFQVLIGILRAWNPIAGQRADELMPGIGKGSIKDASGRQVVKIASTLSYVFVGNEVNSYVNKVKMAISNSDALRKSLFLFGVRDRNAAECYMVYELAKTTFKGKKNISKLLGIPDNLVDKFTMSANNLSPLEGGRHSTMNKVAQMGLDELIYFTSGLLKKWILHTVS